MAEMEERCPKCSGEGVIAVLVPAEDPGVKHQGIQGALILEKDKLVECECAIINRLKFAMPAEVRQAIVQPAHAAHPITGMMGRSLFIKSTYADMLSIIKAAVYKNNGRYVRTTSDAEIRDVGVGSRSRKAKGDDAKDVYNDFADLMESPPLMVIWLNKLGHKNRAAAGFLIEALTVRIDKRKPTWVVSDLDNPFGPGSMAFSDAIWSFLHIGFQKMEVPRILKFDDLTSTSTPAPAPAAPPAFETEFVPNRQSGGQKHRAPQPSEDPDVPDALKNIGVGSKRSSKLRGRFD
jgi:hypothetical protein